LAEPPLGFGGGSPQGHPRITPVSVRPPAPVSVSPRAVWPIPATSAPKHLAHTWRMTRVTSMTRATSTAAAKILHTNCSMFCSYSATECSCGYQLLTSPFESPSPPPPLAPYPARDCFFHVACSTRSGLVLPNTTLLMIRGRLCYIILVRK